MKRQNKVRRRKSKKGERQDGIVRRRKEVEKE